MRFHFDPRKSKKLRENPKRGIGFEEAQEIFAHPYYVDARSDVSEQYRATGWVGYGLAPILSFRAEQADFLLPRSSSNASACAVEESLCNLLPTAHALEIHARGEKTL